MRPAGRLAVATKARRVAGTKESRESHVRPESLVPRAGPAEAGHGEAPLLCQCRLRTAEEIRAEILRFGLKTVEEVYARVLGGGGCRTCAPEIRKLLSETGVLPGFEPRPETGSAR